VQGTTLQVPTTGYHTMEETCSRTSNKALNELLMSIAGI